MDLNFALTARIIEAISDYDEGSKYRENYILFYIVVSFAKKTIFETCRLVLRFLFRVEYFGRTLTNRGFCYLPNSVCSLASTNVSSSRVLLSFMFMTFLCFLSLTHSSLCLLSSRIVQPQDQPRL